MGDIGGGMQAGASMIDTAATNEANMQMQQIANQFNAQQAGIQRDWSAGQAATQRQYQTSEREAAQSYETEMSNTAVQRRADDIRQAGFNPLLAVGQLGGASSPSSGGMPGSMPSGSAASAAGVAHLQPLLGNAAALNLTNAQAANVKADTRNKGFQGDILSDQADQWAVDTSPQMLFKRTQAMAAQYDLDYSKANEVNSIVDQIRNAAKMSDSQVKGIDLDNELKRLDVNQTRALYDYSVRMQQAQMTQQTQEARNVTDAQSGLLGQVIAKAQAILTPVSSAAGAASHAAGATKALIGAGGALVE